MYKDGSVFHGEWVNGVLNGEVKWQHATAFIAEGSYEKGVPAQVSPPPTPNKKNLKIK
jgi:hypothetical protein